MGGNSTSSMFSSSADFNIKRKPVLAQFADLPSQQTSQFSDKNITKGVSAIDKYNAINSSDAFHEGESGTSRLDGQFAKRNALLHPLTTWKWELLSLVIAVLALISIIGLLRAYENKDLSEWKVPLSINAIVAILSAIFKGSLALPIADGISQLKWLWFTKRRRNLVDMDTYDRASRSVWGSLVFLGKFAHELQLSPLAAFGALFTLLTLIVDPFSQASIWPREGAGVQALDVPMQVAITMGLTKPPANSSESIKSSIVCPTGNCTFSETGTGLFSSISMCHKCLDVTHDLKKDIYNSTVPFNGGSVPVQITRYAYQHNDTIIAGRGYGVHHELRIGNDSLYNNMDIQGGFGVPANFTAHSVTYIDGDPLLGRLFPEGGWDDTVLASFQGIALTADNYTCVSYAESDCSHIPFAFDCALQPCVKFLNSTVSNGVYREQEIGRHYLHRQEATPGFEVGLSETYINGTLRDCTPAKRKSDSHPFAVATPETQNAQHESEKEYLWYPSECGHLFSEDATFALSQYLVHLFQKAELAQDPAVKGDPWLVQLWNDSHIDMSSVDALFGGLATSIGSQMRNVAGTEHIENGMTLANATHLPGYAESLRPCIRVRWKFLSFPAVLIVAELVFFVTVILFNWHNAWDGNWKSSTLPFIFQSNSVQWPHDAEGRPATDEQDLRKAIRQVQGKLVQDQNDGIWKFSTTAKAMPE